MKSLKFIIISLVITIMTGCSTLEHRGCDSYVEEYYKIKDIELVYNRLGLGEICVSPSKEYGKTCNFLSKGDEKTQYRKLCEKHNDFSFYHKVPVIDGKEIIFNYSYPSVDFSKILITSNVDIDENHKAGSSLNDIIRFISFSSNRFIKNGYTQRYDYVSDTSLSKQFREIIYSSYMFLGNETGTNELKAPMTMFPIDKLVSDVTTEDLTLLGVRLMGPLFYLSFENKPKFGFDINVQLYADNGNIFESEVSISPED